MVDEGFRADPRVETFHTSSFPRANSLRVMILPFVHLGPRAKGWRALGERQSG